MASKPKSLKVAYALFAVLGFQGVHQFYLGNWKRGLMLAFFVHVPMFSFAYLDDLQRKTGEPPALVPLLLILIGLLIGLGLFLVDLFTLHKQVGTNVKD